MAKFIIHGQQPLSGEIEVYGAKNAALKMIPASLLINGITILENVPDILDIQKIIQILKKLGVKFERSGHQLTIDTTNITQLEPDKDLVGSIRASIILVGPLLARFGKVRLTHPGGCTIGSRPIDLHLKAFQDLGITTKQTNDFYEFNLDINRPLKNEVTFDNISVGATENIILFSALQEESITIKNAAIEPEIIDLINFLNKAGTNITVNGRTLYVQGNKTLHPVKYRIIPDRIEAGTFLILAATTKNDLKIVNVIPEHIEALLSKFLEMGIEFEKGPDFVYIKKPGEIRPTEISTAPYPDFPTDLQPPMGVLLTQSKGKSTIRENLFDNRLEYLKELQKMGAQIDILSQHEAYINGPTSLKSSDINSLDLRAGATLLIAGLTASGQTTIEKAENIDRGYEKIEERLKKVGAKIQRVI